MVSGPDMGAGFLFQLTLERSGAASRFVYHAQAGGSDANGPPKGSPEPLGWRPPSAMCPFGGRLCWHREFWLADTETLRVRTAYNRTRFVMEASIDQLDGKRPVPVEASLELLLGRAPEPPAAWALSGAMALALQGAPIRARSIEIDGTEAAIRAWAAALEEYLIEMPAPTIGPGACRRFGARAFVGTLRDGTRVEWTERSPDPAGGPALRPDPDRVVDWNGQRVPVRAPARIRGDAVEDGRADVAEAAQGLDG